MEDGNGNILNYDEIEKSIPVLIEEIRQRIQDKHNLIIPNHCDGFITRCLRLKDGNVEKATKLIMSFHAAILDFPKWDATFKPTVYSGFYDCLPIVPLAKRDSLGRRIVLLRGGQWEPQDFNFDGILASAWMISQLFNAEMDTQRAGYVSVWDFSNFGARHAFAVNHRRFRALGKWFQNGVLGRIKEFHVVNHAWAVGVLYTALKPFLKEKLKRRVKFHNSLETLHEYVDEETLPKMVGGTLDDKECIDTQLMEDLFKHDYYFEEMMNDKFPRK